MDFGGQILHSTRHLRLLTPDKTLLQMPRHIFLRKKAQHRRHKHHLSMTVGFLMEAMVMEAMGAMGATGAMGKMGAMEAMGTVGLVGVG